MSQTPSALPTAFPADSEDAPPDVAPQPLLPFPRQNATGREDFFESGSNREAVAMVDNWRAWTNGVRALAGPPGAGKTHLGSVWSYLAGAERRSGKTLHLDDAAIALEGGALFIDDADAADEKTLFHVLAAARQGEGRVLMAACTPPRQWRVELTDLATRLNAVDAVRIDAPDDALLIGVMDKLLRDRHMKVKPRLLKYAVVRMDRSFASARRLAAGIEAAAARGEKITTRLIDEILQTQDGAPALRLGGFDHGRK